MNAYLSITRGGAGAGRAVPAFSASLRHARGPGSTGGPFLRADRLLHIASRTLAPAPA